MDRRIDKLIKEKLNKVDPGYKFQHNINICSWNILKIFIDVLGKLKSGFHLLYQWLAVGPLRFHSVLDWVFNCYEIRNGKTFAIFDRYAIRQVTYSKCEKCDYTFYNKFNESTVWRSSSLPLKSFYRKQQLFVGEHCQSHKKCNQCGGVCRTVEDNEKSR